MWYKLMDGGKAEINLEGVQADQWVKQENYLSLPITAWKMVENKNR